MAFSGRVRWCGGSTARPRSFLPPDEPCCCSLRTLGWPRRSPNIRTVYPTRSAGFTAPSASSLRWCSVRPTRRLPPPGASIIATLRSPAPCRKAAAFFREGRRIARMMSRRCAGSSRPWSTAQLLPSKLSTRRSRPKSASAITARSDCLRRFSAFRKPPCRKAGRHFQIMSNRWSARTCSPVGDAARRIAESLFEGSGTWLRSPNWYRALTASLLPERLRDDFGLLYGRSEQRAVRRALALLRSLYPRIPARLRYVAPYHEACARLAGRRPGAVTRRLNRFWIGRDSMAG